MTLVDSLLENASKASFEALSLPLSLQKEYEKSSAKKIISNFEIDKQIASIMVLAPWVCLVVLYLGSHDYFNEGLITCAQHGFVEEMASVLHKSEACQSQCDNYRLADYHFLNSYCYTRMENSLVNENGTNLGSYSVQRYKLYPYVLFCLSLLGFLDYVIWQAARHDREKQTAFILDGIIAACDELFITLKEIQQEFHAKNGVGSKIDVFWLNNKVDSKWKEKGVRDEFRELEHAMKMRANKHGMVANVIFCRIVTIILCLLAMFVIGYFYLFDNFIASTFYRSLASIDSSIKEKYDQFNCELPPNYWYYRGEEDEKILWKVTTCFIKPIQIYRTVSAMLFGIYGLLIISYLQQSIHNIQLWRKKLLFLEFLPLNTYSHVQNHFLTDLHVIFALIDLNEQSNVSLRVAHGVMVALEEEERPRFLSILLEMIDWKYNIRTEAQHLHDNHSDAQDEPKHG